MKFDSPAGETIADRKVFIGKPTPRIDGPLKTSGLAPYAYERHDVAPDALYGYPLGAAIAKGRIRAMDTRAAAAGPGVAAVVTALDMDALPKASWNVAHLFGGREIEHYHQAIAVVVADSMEMARAAAALIRVEYERDKETAFDLPAAHTSLLTQEAEPVSRVGDFEGAYAAAPVTLDETYTTPPQSHAMMEPHATIRAVGWRQADPLDIQPDDCLEPRFNRGRLQAYRLRTSGWIPPISGAASARSCLSAPMRSWRRWRRARSVEP